MKSQTIELGGFRITIEQLVENPGLEVSSANSLDYIASEIGRRLGYSTRLLRDRKRDTLRANLRAIFCYKAYGAGYTHREIGEYLRRSGPACRYEERRLRNLLVLEEAGEHLGLDNNDLNLLLMYHKV